MKNILVTGGTGFVGSNLVRALLRKDYRVHLLLRDSSRLHNMQELANKIKIHRYDNDIDKLSEYMLRNNIEMVIHLASCFVSEHKKDQINELINSNILFGTHVIEAMIQSGVKKLINTGTSWQHYNNENYNPVNLYAATKQAFEDIIEYYVQGKKLQVITLELFDTYGPNDYRKKIINLLQQYSNTRELLQMSPGDQMIDLVFIDDVVDAYIVSIDLIEKMENIHQKYTISSGVPIRLRNLVNKYIEITGNEVNVQWGGREYREREVMQVWDKGVKIPNWKAKVSIDEGLRRLISTEG